MMRFSCGQWLPKLPRCGSAAYQKPFFPPGWHLQMLEVLIEELQPTAMTQEAAGLWIAPSMAGDTILDLYCFPSAGSSATDQYEGWHERLPSFIRVKVRPQVEKGSRCSDMQSPFLPSDGDILASHP